MLEISNIEIAMFLYSIVYVHMYIYAYAYYMVAKTHRMP